MILNMKLGTSNIKVICVLSVSVVSHHPFVWLFQSILLIINMDLTAFCTILEALDVGTARCVVMRWAYQLGTSHDHTPCHQKIPK